MPCYGYYVRVSSATNLPSADTIYLVCVCTVFVFVFVLVNVVLHDSGTPFIWWNIVAMRSKTPKAARNMGKRVDCTAIILILRQLLAH